MVTRSELLREEVERVTRKTGYYITPERLSELMTRAQKVMSVLGGGRLPLCYADCEIVLNMVRAAIARVNEE